MRLAIVQTDPRFAEIDANIRQALALMEGERADLYVLPELFNTGYNFTDAKEAAQLAEGPTGRTFEALAAFAKKRNCHIVYGFAEKAAVPYNAAAMVGPDGLLGLYRKVHLYAKETTLFAPGDLGFPVIPLPFGNVGMMICFDWLFPESARSLALKGADLIAHPSNLVMPHCPDAMVTRCLENRVFSATANRVGAEDRGGLSLSFIGKSEIVTPRGEILCRLGETQAGVSVREVDLTLARRKSINEWNDILRDRRPAQYDAGRA
jgi:predicted amidohydrolase